MATFAAPDIFHPWMGQCHPFMSDAATGLLYSLTERMDAKAGAFRGMPRKDLVDVIKGLSQTVKTVRDNCPSALEGIDPPAEPVNVVWLRNEDVVLGTCELWQAETGHHISSVGMASYRWDETSQKNRNEFDYRAVYGAGKNAEPAFSLDCDGSKFIREVRDWLKQAEEAGIFALWVDQLCLNQEHDDLMEDVKYHGPLYQHLGVVMVAPRQPSSGKVHHRYLASFSEQVQRGWILSETMAGNRLACIVKRRAADSMTLETAFAPFLRNPDDEIHQGPGLPCLMHLIFRAEQMVPGARPDPVDTAIRLSMAAFTKECDRAVVSQLTGIGLNPAYLEEAETLRAAIVMLSAHARLAGQLADLALRQAMTVRSSMPLPDGASDPGRSSFEEAAAEVRQRRAEVQRLVGTLPDAPSVSLALDFVRLVFLGGFEWDLDKTRHTQLGRRQAGKDLADLLSNGVDPAKERRGQATFLLQQCRLWTVTVYAWADPAQTLAGHCRSSLVVPPGTTSTSSSSSSGFVAVWKQTPDGASVLRAKVKSNDVDGLASSQGECW